MFLRFGQVVGQAGVYSAIAIVLASKVITSLTTLSLSAIATNTRIKGGGAYYLISRSLGVEFGGAIGFVFYLAQTISVAMYVIGFTEAFVATFPSFESNFIAVATFINIATFVCVYIGAGWTIKMQYIILAILVAAIFSFSVGASSDFSVAILQENLYPRYTEGENFFSMFALFFPAVTGIMAGANMSGDLANPARAIPRGTIGAVLVTLLVYLAFAVLLGGACRYEDLIGNNLVIREASRWPIWIVAGVFAATLSSALGSMMGAPRILQAFARDEVFSILRFFSFGSGASNEPRRAVVLTFFIAQVCILLGDLNAIAPIITMFFMITYGLINVATFYESITKNPSYRPTFRYCHWSQALLGAFGCLGVMFLINWAVALVSIVVIFALHRYISYREIEARWGDLQSGAAFERARRSLLRLQDQAYHPKNWRPNFLALSGSGWTRPHLPIYASWLTAGHGILVLAQVVQGELSDHAERCQAYERILRKFIAKQELPAFPAVVVSPDLLSGVQSLIQCQGIGGLRPNTVLLGWPNESESIEQFGSMLRLIGQMGRSTVAIRLLSYRNSDESVDDETVIERLYAAPQGTIDIWWRGMENGALMMLLAHLLHQNPNWRGNKIRMLRIVGKDEAREDVRKHILELAARSRISVEPVVLLAQDVMETIQEASRDAAVVLLGFKAPGKGEENEFFTRLEVLAGKLPRVLFINSAGGMEIDS